MMVTRLYTHPACLTHDMGAGHPESPARLTSILAALKAPEFAELDWAEAPPATFEQIMRAHPPAFIEGVLAAVPAAGLVALDADTILSPGSGVAALCAAGALTTAVDAVARGEIANAFCAVRPPGHHAEASIAMGFCIFNNVAIGARYVQRKYGVRRVLIVDWDYHHGNGTQEAFYQDGSVFYFSTHHYGAYPGTGSAEETGAGKGAGKILNVPLPPGASDAQIVEAFQTKLVPAARNFKPDFILISAGFDGMQNDLLGVFNITPAGFAAITRIVVELSKELCRGRIVSVLEGGYRLDGLAESVLAHVQVLREE